MSGTTLNRIMIAVLLIYFPVVAIGKTGSLWNGFLSFLMLLAAVGLGYTEGKSRLGPEVHVKER